MATKTTKAATKTTARKSTSAGPRRSTAKSTRATAATSEAKPAAVAAKAPVGVVEQSAAAAPKSDDRLRRPDLIEAISARVSVKRSDVKMVMDVMLDELGKALDGADEIVVPPLGKLMVKKRLDKPNGRMLTVKLKRAQPEPFAGDVPPLANAGDEG